MDRGKDHLLISQTIEPEKALMSLNANLGNMLTAIVAACRVPPHHSVQNMKGPLIRALERDGYIARAPGIEDPANADRVGFVATDRGYAELGTAASAPPAPIANLLPGAAVAVQAPTLNPSPIQLNPSTAPAVAQPQTGNPTLSTTTTVAAPKAPRAPRKPYVEPTVQYSGARFTALPPAAPGSRAGGKTPYKFSSLGAPDASGIDSFFVAATPVMPEPFKTVRATVNGANKRFESEGKKFRAIEVTDDLEFHVPGVRVFRIA